VKLRAWADEHVRLSSERAAEIARSGLVEVRLVAPPDQWRLVTDSRVGVVVGRDWELRVEPRLEIPKLLFLLAFARSQDGWRDVMAGFGRDEQLLDVVASGFARHADTAGERGLMRGYVHVEERRQDIRGRVRFADQIARLPGLPLPVEVAYDEHTADVRENRLLKTAGEILLRLPRIPLRARSRLLRLRSLLDEVSILRDPRDFVRPPITRLNVRYEPALVLAELILRRTSITAESGEVSSASFVFDMNRVFEDFVSAALADALRRHGGEVRLQHVDRLEETGTALPIKPDITWWSGPQCLAVVDAKYKSIANRSMPNADAYQMLAYCIALSRRRGYLVYAQDSGEVPRAHTIRNSGHVVDVRVLDVALEPEQLLTRVDALASSIVRDAVAAKAA